MTRTIAVAILVWATSVVNVAGVFAQQFRISGTVDDATGVIPGANVTLREPGGATTRTNTDSAGMYQFQELRAGTYELVVERDGYAPSVQTLTVNDALTTVNITLRVAEVLTS